MAEQESNKSDRNNNYLHDYNNQFVTQLLLKTTKLGVRPKWLFDTLVIILTHLATIILLTGFIYKAELQL